jgi:mannan endo-1,4-beta-mannosidase
MNNKKTKSKAIVVTILMLLITMTSFVNVVGSDDFIDRLNERLSEEEKISDEQEPEYVLSPMDETFDTMDDSWLDGWEYRKEITVSNKIEGYQTKITVSQSEDTSDDVDCNGKSNDNFSDLRFAASNGSLVPYWIEEKTDGDDCTVWIKNEYNDTTLYMYYGNSGASDASNGDNTFPIYFDDWTSDNTGDFSVTTSSNRKKFSYDLGSDTLPVSYRFRYSASAEWQDYNKWGLSGYVSVSESHLSSTTSNRIGAYYIGKSGYSSVGNYVGTRLTGSDMFSKIHGVFAVHELNVTQGSYDVEYLHSNDPYVSGYGDDLTYPEVGSQRYLTFLAISGSNGITTSLTHMPDDDLLRFFFRRSDYNRGDTYVYVDWMFISEFTPNTEPSFSFSDEERQGFNDGYPYAEKSFKVDEFVQVSKPMEQAGEPLAPTNTFNPMSGGWLDGWDYRKPITVTDKIEGYQTLINVSYDDGGDVYCEGNSNSNFSDLRFTTESGTLVPYWIEYKEYGDYAIVWVNNLYNDTNLYMYYGNSEANCESDGNETFVYFNDFSTAPSISKTDYGNGACYYFGDFNHSGGFIINYDWYIYSLKSGKYGARRAWSLANDDDSELIHYIRTSDDTDHGTPPRIMLDDWYQVSTSTWYSISSRYIPNVEHKLYLNNNLIDAIATPGTDENFTRIRWGTADYTSGVTDLTWDSNNERLDAVGWRRDSGVYIKTYIDNLYIARFDVNEPSFSFGSEESQGFNDGFPYAEKSFKVDEFVETFDTMEDGPHFTLGDQRYRFLGSDSYYLVDYACDLTYDDDGNEITNSKQYVLEILNKASHLNINVLRTWAGMQGGNDSHWPREKVGGHWNLFEIDTPGNWSEDTYVALDWVVYQAKQRDIRLMPVFVNNWNDYGGMRWYVQMSPTTDKTNSSIDDHSDDRWHQFKDQFYTDANCKQYYKDAVEKILTRVNTYTGVAYKDEPAIFGWSLANEPRAKSAGTNHSVIANWVDEMAAFVKNIDSNHTLSVGIEGWGINETWGEGTNITCQNFSNIDYATFALHPDEWAYFAERSEGETNGSWITDNVESDNFINWWTNMTNITYNNRYSSGNEPLFIPDEGRHGYKAWTIQQVEWAKELLNMPVVCQEVGYKSSHPDAVRNKFFNQSIYNFFNSGGDGMMYWTLNHDNYYYSTDTPGDMDDGYGFYVSTNETLKAKSKAVMDAFDFAKTNNSGGSWVTSMNDKTYDFIGNATELEGQTLENITLFLKIYNSTGNRSVSNVNDTAVVYNTTYTFTYQFETTDLETDWYMQINTNESQVNSSEQNLQFTNLMPSLTLNEPVDNHETLDQQVSFNYTVSSDIDMAKAELFIDDELVETNTSVETSTPQYFNRTLGEGDYTWYVKVTTVRATHDTSETRNLRINVIPEPPTNFRITERGHNFFTLYWTKGINATRTYIRYAEGDTPPADRTTGTFLYNGTGSTTSASGLKPETKYSFSAWSFGSGGFNDTKATTYNITENAYSEGNGTINNPYNISTTDEMDAVRYYTDKNFSIKNDIDFDYDGWTIISTFTGSIKGNKYTISNLSISGSDYTGLFGTIGSGGKVTNLTLSDFDVSGENNVGILAGRINGATVINCSVNGTVYGSSYVGGLAGITLSTSVIEKS